MLQSADGQFIFADALSSRMMLEEHGTWLAVPSVIHAPVLELASHSMADEAVRKRFKSLGHLPSSATFTVAELDVSGLVSPAVRKRAQEQLTRRAERRRARAAEAAASEAAAKREREREARRHGKSALAFELEMLTLDEVAAARRRQELMARASLPSVEVGEGVGAAVAATAGGEGGSRLVCDHGAQRLCSDRTHPHLLYLRWLAQDGAILYFVSKRGAIPGGGRRRRRAALCALAVLSRRLFPIVASAGARGRQPVSLPARGPDAAPPSCVPPWGRRFWEWRHVGSSRRRWSWRRSGRHVATRGQGRRRWGGQGRFGLSRRHGWGRSSCRRRD